MKHSILFVCTGNTCRSPMAEAILKHMLNKEGIAGVDVWSRGVAPPVGAAASDGIVEALQEIGIPAPDHKAMRLTPKDIERATLILTMEEGHRQRVIQLDPKAADKTFRLKQYAGDDGAPDVEDPIGGSREDYEKCRIEIQNCLLNLFLKLKSV